MIVKTVRFGNWYSGSFDPKDCRGRLMMDDKGVIRYSNPDLLKPFKPVSGKLNLRREKVEKWKDRLVKVIGGNRQKRCEGLPHSAAEKIKRMIGAKCGPFTLLETDGHRMLMERGEAAPGAYDTTRSGLHETPNLKAIADWLPEFELPVRRARTAVEDEPYRLTLTLYPESGRLVLTAKSEEVEYEEELPFAGCITVPTRGATDDQAPIGQTPVPAPESSPEPASVIEVNLNSDYVHDGCGLQLELYLQGPEEPVTWATPDDRYRYVLMPLRPQEHVPRETCIPLINGDTGISE